MRSAFIALFALITLPTCVAFAQQAQTPNAVATRKRVELLIEQLASRNEAPPVKGNAGRGEDQVIRFPATYDKTLQVPVYSAYKALLAEEDDAVDVLVAHREDPRYSYSVNTSADYNVSVGEACATIAAAMIIGFENELHVISRAQFGVFPALNYREKHQKSSIAAIQILAINAMTEYFRDADGETALPWHPDAARLPLPEFNRRREENLKTLSAIRRYVSDTGKRYRSTQIDGAHDCMFGLPWGGRRHNK